MTAFEAPAAADEEDGAGVVARAEAAGLREGGAEAGCADASGADEMGVQDVDEEVA